MVSSIGINGLAGGAASGLSSLGADPRTRATLSLLNAQTDPTSTDQVNLGDAALWSASRQSVQDGLGQLDKTVSAGEGVERTLVSLQDAAKAYVADPSGGRGDIDTLLQALSSSADKAEAGGARLVRGQSLSVTAEPGAAPISISGLDLQVHSDPNENDLLQVDPNADPADIEQQAKLSLENLRGQLGRLEGARDTLSTHAGLLGAAAGSVQAGVSTDIDAEGARLLALQVRQGLNQTGGSASIVNVEPQAVLSLFRA